MTTSLKRLLLASAFALALPAAAGAAGTELDTAAPESWRAGYDEAVQLIKAEKYDQAITKLKALKADASADVNNQIGYAYRQTGKWDEAVRYYEAALRIEPQHKGALEYYGEYFVWRGDMKKAQEHLARLEKACGGKTCPEYQELAAAIGKKAATN